MRSPRPDEALRRQIEMAVQALKRGGVVAVPTDTLYGLAASIYDVEAVRRVFRLKGRPDGMALPVLLADTQDIRRCAAEIPDLAWTLAERFWPGVLTLVLKKVPAVPNAVTGGMGTVALRVPDHWVPREIARGLGAPITGTSANRTSQPGLTRAEDVRAEFGGELDLVVDAGEAPGGLASTVLDLTGYRPRILRQGAVSAQELREVCDDILRDDD